MLGCQVLILLQVGAFCQYTAFCFLSGSFLLHVWLTQEFICRLLLKSMEVNLLLGLLMVLSDSSTSEHLKCKLIRGLLLSVIAVIVKASDISVVLLPC